MEIVFAKIEGLGNDYIYVEDWDGTFISKVGDFAGFVKAITDRRVGVGSDGVILLQNSNLPNASFKMRIFNIDASEAEMCGNGVRGFVKYIFDRKISTSPTISIETGGGIVITSVEKHRETWDKKLVASHVRVNMGHPKSRGEVLHVGHPPSSETIALDSGKYEALTISFGNPHCVLFVDDFEFDWMRLGKQIEVHPMFPNRTNVEFVQVVNPQELNVRIWERGSGYTTCCGSGACASAVAAIMKESTSNCVKVNFERGHLDIEWNERDGCIYMTGPTNEVFVGIYKHPSAIS